MALPRPDDLMAIAHIVRAHGVHGEVSAIVLAPPVLDGAELIEDRRLYARGPKGDVREMTGLAVRPHQDRWLITLEGVETMDEADALRGVDLCLPALNFPNSLKAGIGNPTSSFAGLSTALWARSARSRGSISPSFNPKSRSNALTARLP